MYAGLIFVSSASTCVVDCPVRLLTPARVCEETDADTMYAARCFGCTERDQIRVGCVSSIPLAICNSTSTGAVLNAQSCSGFVASSSLLLSGFGDDAGGACIEYLATTTKADPNSASSVTLAERSVGPGIVLVTKSREASAKGLFSSACRNVTRAKEDLLALGPMCYDVPLSISLRPLTLPGLGVFVFAFMITALVAIVLSVFSCFLRE